ncbi:Rad50 meiotic double strand DNA break [Paramicrosporidium saccamoebae]|uniref:DNA repair protein RAD50 n=1 Tax=Paramicrosporidium saccamoebae TaxID=1246581 RepID=A0A2H9THX1_9FUNG|nr:Rad50 meiotic double strand DNA break [Paramicrosporidium saccamoebae]
MTTRSFVGGGVWSGVLSEVLGDSLGRLLDVSLDGSLGKPLDGSLGKSPDASPYRPPGDSDMGMSSFDKLLIRGIRSFSPYNESVIEFYTPLTIIVGQNGAGKTTIIECLKYATTGDLPPNAKGGAFVHDPKVSREAEVKGQIKLKFKNVRGQTMVCTRSMQSTQKKTKLEQKTLESVLATTDLQTGEQVSISSRCAEMDAEVPLQLGVSRAVLENVLFCHQEESFWPLSEPSILKKKFDDIFAATRYTKALDTLKGLRKDLAAELKLEQQKLDFLRSDKEKAGKVRLEVERNLVRREEGRARIEAIEAQMTLVNAAIEKLTDDLKRLSDLHAELERMQHDMKVTEQSQNDLLQGLCIMSENDEILQVLLDQHLQRTRTSESGLAEMQKKRQHIEAAISDQSRALSTKLTEAGIMEAELSRLTDKKAKRTVLLASLCSELEIPMGDSLVQSSTLASEKMQTMKDSWSLLQKEIREEEDALRQKIQHTGTKVSSLTETKRMKKRSMEEHQMKLATTIDQISTVSSARDQLDELQLRLLEDEGVLNSSRTLFLGANYEERLEVLAQKRKEVDEKVQEINNQIASSTKFSQVRAKLQLKKGELERKNEMVHKIFNDIKSELEVFAESAVAIEDAECEGERIWREKEQALKAIQERNEKLLHTSSFERSKHEHAQALYSRKETELNEKMRKLEQVCGREDFGMHLAELEADYNLACSEITLSLASKATYEAFNSTFLKGKNCPLCERGFDSKMDEELFISNIPEKTLEIENRKRNLEAKLAELKGLRSTSDDVDRLKLVELPELANELKILENGKDHAQAAFDDIASELSTAVLEEKKTSSLKKRTEEMGKIQREIGFLQSDVDSLENEMRIGGVSGDIDGIQERQSELQRESQSIAKEMEHISNEMKCRRADLQSREGRFRDIKEQIMKIQLKQSESIRWEQTKSELEQSIQTAREEIALTEAELERWTLDLSVHQDRLNKLQNENSVKEADANARWIKVEQSNREYCSIHNEVEKMEDSCSVDMLEMLRHDKEQIQALLTEQQSELDKINEQIAVFSKATSEAVVEERNIRDNLKYRELEKRLTTTKMQMTELTSKLGTFDCQSANSSLQRHELRHCELLGERSGIFGEIRQLQDQNERLQNELSTDYRSIEENYRDQFVRFNATTLAIEDLEKYSKALDQAIMQFHAHKMGEVNRIIREIWTSTYQGADIDTIEIRADQEGVGGRSYNYRVVMLKGDTELDMRGRSSAGQRVLASLIIRLALAETFGQHCGVIALDEPTTNLDRDNIESLASSLVDIIKMRGQQGNFQLIVITHDEEFVDSLGRHECADYYWRVGKDSNQYSTIERQSFHGL